MKWSVAKPDEARVSALCRDLGISAFLAGVLVGRDMGSAQEAERYLNPKLKDFPDPLSIPEVAKASQRLFDAIEHKQHTAVFGDYDVDGMTSVSLVVDFLRGLGAKVTWRVPHRLAGGYGMNQERVEELASVGPDLVVTVDCGTSSVHEVEWLKARGIDCIVTDHHQVHGEAPKALAMVNPHAWADAMGCADLSGVGMAFLVVCGTTVLLKRAGWPTDRLTDVKDYLDLVALGTVADMVPLRNVNRALVSRGLKVLAEGGRRPGLTALKDVARCRDKVLSTSTIAFGLAPRLNAAGRMGSAADGVDLLLATEVGEAEAIMKRLEERNTERRELEARMFREAQEMVGARWPGGEYGTLVLARDDWHLGVVGIVASRVSELYFRPALLLAIDGDRATGSARSVPGFDIGHALATCSDILVRFGGHSQAAGLTVTLDRLEELQTRLDVQFDAARHSVSEEPVLDVDLEYAIEQLDPGIVRDVERMAPFGTDNPEPVLVSRRVRVNRRTTLAGDHLKLLVEASGRKLEAVWWRNGSFPVEAGQMIDLAYVPEMRTFEGQTFLSLRVKDIHVSGG